MQISVEAKNKFGVPVILSNKVLSHFIFYPTKDRPRLLQRSLQALASDCCHSYNFFQTTVVVIDDSVYKHNRLANQRLIKKILRLKIIYYGRKEQQLMFIRLNRGFGIPMMYLRKNFCSLGETNSDLGGVRNHVLLLANLWGEKNSVIAMIDDDILLALPRQVKGQKQGFLAKMMQLVEQDNLAIVGARLEGAPDASTLERACLKFTKMAKTSCFILPKRPISISGGLMVFSMHWATWVPFPRTYNEDWIWMCRCSMLGGRLIRSPLRAKHCYFSKVVANDKKLYKELIGELFFEGWNWAYSNYKNPDYCYCALRKKSYWADVIREELHYINRIKTFIIRSAKRRRKNRIQKQLQQTSSIIDKAHSIIKRIQPEKMIRLTNNYIINTILWRKIAQKIRKTTMTNTENLVLRK